MAAPDGFRKALSTFRAASRDTAAYRRFLAAHHVAPGRVRTIEDWERLPTMDKKSYLLSYPLKELFPHGRMPAMAYASSGSSGEPTFWFRGDAEEEAGTKIHERIFRETFGIRKTDATLVVVCFSMGIWVAGGYTAACVRGLSRRGYRMTVVTPGIEMEDIMSVLKRIAPQFSRVVLAGYPPFLMDVVGEAVRRRIPLRSSMRFLTAGDKFSEPWRASLAEMIGSKDMLRTVIGIYGSADAGILGYETPLSIFLRRQAVADPGFGSVLWGGEATTPALSQYDPAHIFFEERAGELLFTAHTAAALIRYDIHDVGHIITSSEMRSLAERAGLGVRARRFGGSSARYPFVVKGSRNDVAVTFYALNIYPENIKGALEAEELRRLASGQFFAFNRSVARNKRQELCVDIELRRGIRPGNSVVRRVRERLVDHLTAQNIEYRKLRSAIGDRALPKVFVTPFGKRRFHEKGLRGLAGAVGKKTKMVTT